MWWAPHLIGASPRSVSSGGAWWGDFGVPLHGAQWGAGRRLIGGQVAQVARDQVAGSNTARPFLGRRGSIARMPLRRLRWRKLGVWIVMDSFRLFGNLACETGPRRRDAPLVAARFAASALVGDMFGEYSLPDIWHPRHDLSHGHVHDLLESHRPGNDGPARGVTQSRGVLT